MGERTFLPREMVEAGGIEPPSERQEPAETTSVSYDLISPVDRPQAGYHQASSFLLLRLLRT